jgi:topoisomerase IA-like protein
MEREYVQIKDIEGIKIETTRYIAKSSNPKSIDVESKDLMIGKEKKKLIPTALGRNITEFLELNFPMIMDYKFTANMEKELDDVAEGTIKKIKIIKDFHAYLEKQITNIKQTVVNNAIIGKTDSGTEVIMANGKFGKYLICGDVKLNLKYLLTNNSYGITEINAESNSVALMDLVNKKLAEPEDSSDSVNAKKNKIKIYKEWTKGKIKYNLKLGQYGYYLEEIGSTGKKTNWAMSFLIKKIARDNLIDDIDENIIDIAEKISIKDIQSNIDYFKNTKKKKN